MNFVATMLVVSLYAFKGAHNDELTFAKGARITVTQRIDGGWWEGTVQGTGKTGWFPSNYVKVRRLAGQGGDGVPRAGSETQGGANLRAKFTFHLGQEGCCYKNLFCPRPKVISSDQWNSLV